jgi:hypothetical protein
MKDLRCSVTGSLRIDLTIASSSIESPFVGRSGFCIISFVSAMFAEVSVCVIPFGTAAAW